MKHSLNQALTKENENIVSLPQSPLRGDLGGLYFRTKRNYNQIIWGGLLFLSFSLQGYGQAGITTSGLTQQQEQDKAKANSGFDNSTHSSSSAIQQLELMTGTKISGNGNTNSNMTTTVKPKTYSVSPSVSFQNTMKMQLASGLAEAFFNLIFSDNSQNQAAKAQQEAQAQEEQKQKAIMLALQAAAEQRYYDSIAQAKYAKMMQSYKLLNDPGAGQFKQLSNTDVSFKSLPTQDEMDRARLTGKGLSVTWDFNAWAQVQSGGNSLKETAGTGATDAGGPDAYLAKALDKIETFEGGRVAALSGRFMKNILNESMSYIKDASDAAVSGNMSRMEELGNMDLRKLTSNAIYKTGKETITAYASQAKDWATDEIKSENFAIMQSGGQTLLQHYGVYSHVADDWKVALQKY